MGDLLIKEKPKIQLEHFLKFWQTLKPMEIEKARHIINQELYSAPNIGTQYDNYLQKIQSRWYSSLKSNDPDYSIYNDDYYLAESWFCWVRCSRNYVNSLNRKNGLSKDITVYQYLKGINSVLDLDAGIGYSTAALKQLFKSCDVSAFEIYGTTQYEFCKIMGAQYGFKVISDIDKLPNVDLIFASEYFEHFERPIEHLINIIENSNPKYFYIANSFRRSGRGHFNKYKHLNTVYDKNVISKVFNDRLKYFGYEKQNTNLWQNRPNFWEKKTNKKLEKDKGLCRFI